MSLDVYLKADNPLGIGGGEQIFVREGGATKSISREEWDRRFPGQEPVTFTEPDVSTTVYRANITHNLTAMADAAGIYQPLWRPEELGMTKGSDLIEPLSKGLDTLRAEPEKFRQFNPSNNWGSYEGLVAFVEGYLLACKAHPGATIGTWR